MSEAKTPLGDAIRHWAAEARAELPADPPGEADLEAYLERRLPEDQKAELRRHLVLDPDATARYLEKVQAGTEKDREAVVEALLASGETPWKTSMTWFSRAAWLAAAVLISGLGLGLWGLREASRPELERTASVLGPEPRILELSTGRRVPPIDTPEGQVEANGSPIVVSLTLVDTETLEGYHVELVSPAGRILGRRAVRRQPEGHILFSIETAGLALGRYELNLLGESSGNERRVGRYIFELVPPAEGSPPRE